MNNDIDEFLIDQKNHFKLLGQDLIVKLSTEFYTRVYEDTEQWFVDIFPVGGKEVEHNHMILLRNRLGCYSKSI